MVEEIKYSDILLEKQRQCQDFRRYITFKSSGKFVKHRLGCDINFIREWISSMFTNVMGS